MGAEPQSAHSARANGASPAAPLRGPEADYVIVGAGSAGCVLANRLSEDSNVSVVLLEAGPPDSSPWIHLPCGVQRAVGDMRINWGLETEPESQMHDRRIPVPRGRTLGGCSSINGMVYMRGQPQDYDGWAAGGCDGWSWNEVLPYFKRCENNDRGADAFHGADGPLRVSTVRDRRKLALSFIAAAGACGIPPTEDFNGPDQEGAGFFQYTGWKGRRSSASVAYLRPVRHRTNLRIETSVRATSIHFTGRRADGVEYLQQGNKFLVRARKEVILAAGTIHSPQLLLLSGIGPKDQLDRFDIPVRVDCASVGKNLQDHLQARLLFKATEPVTLNDISRSATRKFLEGTRYLLTRRGLLAEPPIKSGLFVRSRPDLDRPDIQFHLLEFSSDGPGKPLHLFPGFYLAACFLRPESRGEVSLRSPDPLERPNIVHNFLSSKVDCDRMVAGAKLARRIARQAPLKDLILQELQPEPSLIDDHDLLEWVRANAVTVFHPVGTCRMGSDDQSVVDPQLRVRHVEGLRVVDGSVIPAQVSGNTNAPILMIAEKAADMIRGKSYSKGGPT